MNDSTHTEAVSEASELADSCSASRAGQLLRDARQRQGLHLAVLSLKLKVPVQQLEALEADAHDLTQGPVFVRALAASVCRQLNIDPAPVLALLPKASEKLPMQRASRVPLPSAPRSSFGGLALVRGLPRVTLAIAGLMLGLIAALLWMPSPTTWSWFQPAPIVSVQDVPAIAPQAPEPPLSERQVLPLEPAAASSAPVPAASASAMSSPSVPVSGVGATLGFSASQDSWIEIRDGHNQVLWSRLMRSGDTAHVQYPLPLRVVVGRADAVKVSYRGKAFDLAPHTKVTVARFEVKE